MKAPDLSELLEKSGEGVDTEDTSSNDNVSTEEQDGGDFTVDLSEIESSK
ncbi:hypothetical protein IJL65_00670 [bacterium]|nr:hypothetical protein [bacterium]